MRAKLFLIPMTLLLAAWTHGKYSSLPCDPVICAEAYSVTRTMTTNYAGPLFQLYNGSTTLDIGQINGAVDLSTWSAFCSGQVVNCKYSKFYGQINGNHLVPAVFAAPYGPNCTGSPVYKCGAPFSIEVATGLPIISTGASQEYTLASDANATGVNGPGSDLSIVYNGRSVYLAGGMCCGPFGIGHPYNGADVKGTDFFISVAYGQWDTVGNQCQTVSTYCIGIDEESEGDWIDYGSSIINLVAIITYNQSANKVTANLNGTDVINKTPVATFSNTGNTIHQPAGGDQDADSPGAGPDRKSVV